MRCFFGFNNINWPSIQVGTSFSPSCSPPFWSWPSPSFFTPKSPSNFSGVTAVNGVVLRRLLGMDVSLLWRPVCHGLSIGDLPTNYAWYCEETGGRMWWTTGWKGVPDSFGQSQNWCAEVVCAWIDETWEYLKCCLWSIRLRVVPGNYVCTMFFAIKSKR